MPDNIIKFTSDNTESYNQLFTLTELQNSISKSNNSATGPNEIHNTLLRELLTISLKFLLDIYNIWIFGNIPTLWNQATHIPILRKKKRSHKPYCHRPIAVISCSCKTLKRMIIIRLTWFLELNNHLSNLQIVFTAKRSTIYQIVCIETLIQEVFIKKEHVLAVFFDLKKSPTCHGHMASSKIIAYKANSRFL